MNYLRHYAQAQRPVETCVIGSGGFGRSFLAQSLRMPLVNARIAMDVDTDTALKALLSVGIPAEQIAVVTSPAQAQAAWEQGQYLAIRDLTLVLDLPIDLVIEATGNPEAGARHARLAIEANCHVALASKEVDSVVGPELSRLARERGRVVTPVDGDQPALLIGLITWAQTLGFEVLAAGKASEYDFVFDAATGKMSSNGVSVDIPDFAAHWQLAGRASTEIAAARSQSCSALPQRAVPDLCELQVVANSTGFLADTPGLHAPIARIPEVPEFFAQRAEGGVLAGKQTLDVFHCLRAPGEISFAGGVFVIIRCNDKETWELLTGKGHVVSLDGSRAMVFIPRHLLGLEAATSVLDAVVHGASSGAEAPRPVLDLVARATEALKAGTVLQMGGHHHSISGLASELVPAAALAPGVPAPFYLVSNRRLVRDVAPGALICFDDIAIEADSELLRLRLQQDRAFFGPSV